MCGSGLFAVAAPAEGALAQRVGMAATAVPTVAAGTVGESVPAEASGTASAELGCNVLGTRAVPDGVKEPRGGESVPDGKELNVAPAGRPVDEHSYDRLHGLGADGLDEHGKVEFRGESADVGRLVPWAAPGTVFGGALRQGVRH